MQWLKTKSFLHLTQSVREMKSHELFCCNDMQTEGTWLDGLYGHRLLCVKKICVHVCTHCCRFSDRNPGNINWRDDKEGVQTHRDEESLKEGETQATDVHKRPEASQHFWRSTDKRTRKCLFTHRRPSERKQHLKLLLPHPEHGWRSQRLPVGETGIDTFCWKD